MTADGMDQQGFCIVCAVRISQPDRFGRFGGAWSLLRQLASRGG
jgi:hypothetical protein